MSMTARVRRRASLASRPRRGNARAPSYHTPNAHVGVRRGRGRMGSPPCRRFFRRPVTPMGNAAPMGDQRVASLGPRELSCVAPGLGRSVRPRGRDIGVRRIGNTGSEVGGRSPRVERDPLYLARLNIQAQDGDVHIVADDADAGGPCGGLQVAAVRAFGPGVGVVRRRPNPVRQVGKQHLCEAELLPGLGATLPHIAQLGRTGFRSGVCREPIHHVQLGVRARREPCEKIGRGVFMLLRPLSPTGPLMNVFAQWPPT